MILTDTEVAKLRRLLWEIDQGLDKARYKPYVETRNIRLMLTKAERREKNRLL